MNPKEEEHGFSLIELLIVVAIGGHRKLLHAAARPILIHAAEMKTLRNDPTVPATQLAQRRLLEKHRQPVCPAYSLTKTVTTALT